MLGARLFNRWVGIVTALVVLTRPAILRDTLLGYQDLWFMAAVVGAVILEVTRPRRGLAVLVLLAVSAALVGDVPRYRYPIDPLLYAVAAGGLTSLVGLGLAAARRVRADLRARASGPLRRRILRIVGIVSGGGIYGRGRPLGGRAGRLRRQGTEAPGAEVAR
jgi:hypothetical protein